jgi:hypothetical protein
MYCAGFSAKFPGKRVEYDAREELYVSLLGKSHFRIKEVA